MNIPIMRLEIQGMKHALSVALTEHTVKMDADIQDAINKFCTSENVKKIIDEEVGRNLNEIFRESVRDFLLRGDGRKTIEQAVVEKVKWHLGMLKYDDEGKVVEA